MPTTDRTPTETAPDASTDGLAPSEAATPSTRAATASPVRAATPGATDCPRCGTGTINCHGRLDCPECKWTEARSVA
jgi:hypothetical protein